MAKDSDNLAKGFEAENTGGVLSGLLAEEDEFDRHTLWRLGSWAVACVGAVIVAIVANQTSGIRREKIASAEPARQSLQVEQLKESQNEARRLASAIETLNSDRDRLYARIAVLEQGLDSVTGAISRQNSQSTPAQMPPTMASQSVASPGASLPSASLPSATSQGAASANPAAAVAAPPTAPAAAPASSAAATPVATQAPEAPAPVQKPSPAPMPVTAAPPTTTTEKPPILASSADTGPTPALSTAPPASPAPPPSPPSTSIVGSKSMMAPPDSAAAKLIEPSASPKVVIAAPLPEVVASVSPGEEAAEEEQASFAPRLAVQRTEFGVDVGGANSLPGLRALWRGLVKSRSNALLASLRPIIVIKENRNGLGMQLRLVAGPIADAAAAAKICAAMIANDRPCTTAVFDGQRLAMNPDEPVQGADGKPGSDANPDADGNPPRKRSSKRTAPKEEPPSEPSTLSSIFSRRQ